MMDMLVAPLTPSYSLVFTSFIFIIAWDLREMNGIYMCCFNNILDGTFPARMKTAETGKS